MSSSDKILQTHPCLYVRLKRNYRHWMRIENLHLVRMKKTICLLSAGFLLLSFIISCLRITQIILLHIFSVHGVLSKKLAAGDFDSSLIQEPWIHRGKILGLNLKGYDTYCDIIFARPRSCITVANLND